MTSNATLNGTTLHVTSFSGFDVGADITRLRLLESDDAQTHLEVLQGGGLPMPDATILGWETDPSVIAAVEALRQSHATVTFVDPDGTSHSVRVLTFTKQRALPDPFRWTWTLAVVEVS